MSLVSILAGHLMGLVARGMILVSRALASHVVVRHVVACMGVGRRSLHRRRGVMGMILRRRRKGEGEQGCACEGRENTISHKASWNEHGRAAGRRAADVISR